MVVSREFRDHVTDLLAPFGDVKIKLMFGAGGVYFKDQMFAVIDGESIYFKVGDANRADFEAEGVEPFVIETKSGPVATSYYAVPPHVLDDADELAKWARRAYEAAIAGRAKKKKPPRKNAPPRDLPLVSPKKKKKKS